MSMRTNGKKPSTAATAGRFTLSACAALLGLAAAASAQSGPLSIVTHENAAQPGAFTLNFGDLGITASSNITTTTYELSVDPVRGAAHFVSYLQHVQPLALPGGISTGNITVEIVDGSSHGSFDPFTRTFTTSEMYAVHFDGDLSAFGLTSPVLLPSSSSGVVAVDPVDGGVVTMDWTGSGELSNPFDPAHPLTFTYHCAVNTLFPTTAVNLVGLALIPDVASLQLPKEIATRLVGMLDQSMAAIQRGKSASAVQLLRDFIRKVNVLSGRFIDEADAAKLIASASKAIDLIGLGKIQGR